MTRHFIAGCIMLLACACGASKNDLVQSMKDNNMLQEKTVSDYVFRLQYMPAERSGGEDTSLVYFRLNVLNAAGAPMKNTNDPGYSYGLDTLFAFVGAADTIPPVDIIREEGDQPPCTMARQLVSDVKAKEKVSGRIFVISAILEF